MRAFRRADDLPARHLGGELCRQPQRAEGAAPGVGVAKGLIY